MNCGVGWRHGSNPALLWLWRRLGTSICCRYSPKKQKRPYSVCKYLFGTLAWFLKLDCPICICLAFCPWRLKQERFNWNCASSAFSPFLWNRGYSIGTVMSSLWPGFSVTRLFSEYSWYLICRLLEVFQPFRLFENYSFMLKKNTKKDPSYLNILRAHTLQDPQPCLKTCFFLMHVWLNGLSRGNLKYQQPLWGPYFFLWPHSRHAEVLGPGIEPMPQLWPEPQQWLHKILKLLSHQGTQWVTYFYHTKLSDHSSKVSKTEWNVCLSWHFEASKCYQAPNIASLKKILRLSEANC